MSTGRAYIVRHGNTFDKGDVVRRVGGKTDLPLSTSGLQQARLLAETFKILSFAESFSSDLKRTRQTADHILGKGQYQFASFLKEIDYGPDEGRPETEVIARVGSAALRKWDLHAVAPQGWSVNADDLRTAWQAFFASCKPHSNTLVVTSNGVARFLLDVIDGGEAAPRKLRTGAYGIISLDTKGPRLIDWDIRPAE